MLAKSSNLIPLIGSRIGIYVCIIAFVIIAVSPIHLMMCECRMSNVELRISNSEWFDTKRNIHKFTRKWNGRRVQPIK